MPAISSCCSWGKGTLAALAVVAAGAVAPMSRAATPIPQQSPAPGSLPAFVGQPVSPDPMFAPQIPRHPHEAENGRSGIHDDAYQSDTYRTPGPLGRDLTVTSFATWTSTLVAGLTDAGIESEAAITLADTIVAGLEGATMLARARRDAAPLRHVAVAMAALVAAEAPGLSSATGTTQRGPS